ncbi:general stress protein [Cohnella herbarum]|uniref:General stress protein 17M-like domain-containing protein n=1 Tax=Cohnella herbarum TaxID=2728023 RepID=A0A7Z2VK49_9BACL|nr:general stress protein [Cohnella herbarum]QJD84359.1 hypothetical protein HH215_15030 [Cohnella herbarum]
MTVTIGIFEQEEKVLEAIRFLRNAGVDANGIRVIVSNREGAPLLASNGEVNLEELYEIQETRGDEEEVGLPLAAAPLAGGFPVGMGTSLGANPAGVIIAGYDSETGSGSEKTLREIGIPDDAAESCRRAVESGSYVLMAEASSEISLSALLSDAGAHETMS